MAIKMILAAAGLALAFATPAFAEDEMNKSDLPPCSATVTDHCMQTGHMMHGHMMHRHMMHRHMMMRHHHKMMHHDKMMKSDKMEDHKSDNMKKM